MKKYIWFLLLFIFIAAAYTVEACSLAPKRMFFECTIVPDLFNGTCLSDDCRLVINVNSYGEKQVNYILEDNVSGRVATFDERALWFDARALKYFEDLDSSSSKIFFQIADALCVEDVSGLEKPVIDFVNNPKRISTTISMTDPKNAKYKYPDYNDFLSCRYGTTEQYGSWYVKTGGVLRDYCNTGWCASAYISYPKMFTFLITNPGWDTLPYILGFLILFAAIVYGFIYLKRRKELAAFFKPNVFNIVVTIFAIILSYFGIVYNWILWIIMAYMLSSLIIYGYNRITDSSK